MHLEISNTLLWLISSSKLAFLPHTYAHRDALLTQQMWVTRTKPTFWECRLPCLHTPPVYKKLSCLPSSLPQSTNKQADEKDTPWSQYTHPRCEYLFVVSCKETYTAHNGGCPIKPRQRSWRYKENSGSAKPDVAATLLPFSHYKVPLHNHESPCFFYTSFQVDSLTSSKVSQ